MEKVVDGIYWVKGLIAGRVYLIEGNDGLTLIDTSISNSRGKIEKDLGTLGYSMKDIKRILITHAHPDHIGSVSDMQKASGAQVYVHRRDAPVVRGDQPIVVPNVAELTGISRVIVNTMSKTKVEAAPVARELNDGDVLDEVLTGFQVVDTPGHSPGHTAYWWPEKRLMFCGDVVMRLTGRLSKPFRLASPDWPEALRSIRKIANMDVDILCLGHGNPYIGGASTHLRAFAQKIGV